MDEKMRKELEEIAKKFIIDYDHLSVEQKSILSIMDGLQEKLNKLRTEEKRIIRVIEKLNDLLLEEDFQG